MPQILGYRQKIHDFWVRDKGQFITYSHSSGQNIIIFLVPVPQNLITSEWHKKSHRDALWEGTLNSEDTNIFKWVISCLNFTIQGDIIFIIRESKQTCLLLFLSSKAVAIQISLKSWSRTKADTQNCEILGDCIPNLMCNFFLSSLNILLWSLCHQITLSYCDHLQTLHYSLSCP